MHDQELLDIFVSESQEEIKNINKIALDLEKGFNKAYVDEILRFFHTLKGNGASLNYTRFSDTAHLAEDILKEVNSQKIAVSKDLVNFLLKASDYLEGSLKKIIKTGKEETKENGLDDLIPGLKNKKVKIRQKDIDVKKFEFQTPDTLRVKNDKLDKLLHLSSELKNSVEILNEEKLTILREKLKKISRELQDEILELRLISLDEVFSNFPRMIRELANLEKKRIHFTMNCNDIKLDRSIIENLNGPMVHILRNSVDHGIEVSEIRHEKGKEKTGNISINVEKGKDSVLIYIKDDGKGLDHENILRKAIEKGVVDSKKAQTLTKNEIIDLIFKTGFSTKEKTTKISGRGIGMDIVKKALKRIGGDIKINSKKDQGMTITLKLPLSLAIMNVLVIKDKNLTFSIPLIKINSIVNFKEKDLVKGKYEFKGEKIKFTHLSRLYNKKPSKINSVIFIEKGNKVIALGIEEILEKKEILIQKLDKSIEKLNGIGGLTINSENEVCYVLDTDSLLF